MSLHQGHRQRMRDRFLKLGDRALHTHELLEMLLFYSIPYRDTKPLAKTLLNSFGSLGALLDASRGELKTVGGVGEFTASLISSVGRLYLSLISEEESPENTSFSDYNEVGEYFVNYFKGIDKSLVVALFLDSSMHLIASEELYELDYESGAVRADAFIRAAIKHNASTVIIAHNHPRGPIYPSEGDRATNDLIERALNSIDVTLAEHFMVSGKRYLGFMHHLSSGAIALGEEAAELDIPSTEANPLRDRLFDLLSHTNTVKDPSGEVNAALSCYRSLTHLFRQSYQAMLTNAGVSKETALLIRLVASIISRVGTDSFVFGKTGAESELVGYLCSLYFGAVNETVYLIGYDKLGRVAFAEYLSEGSVNSSGISTRQIIEICIKNGVTDVSIAHNHPGGITAFSDEDRTATGTLYNALLGAGIKLKSHYLICGSDYAKLELGSEYVN